MSSTKVLDCGRYIFLPGRNLAGYAIRFTRESLLKVGILSELTGVLANHRIPILFFSISRPEINEPIESLLFVDLTDSSINDIELRNMLKKVREVENVELIKPVYNSLLVDTYFEKLTLGPQRAILFREPMYRALIIETVKQLGSGGNALLYHIGYNMGKSVYKDYIRMVGDEKPEVLIEIGKAFFKLTGLGIIKTVDLNMEKKEALLRVFDNFECSLYKNEKRPVSNLVRGIFAGWFREFFNIQVDAQERKCIAKKDPYCEFIIRPKK